MIKIHQSFLALLFLLPHLIHAHSHETELEHRDRSLLRGSSSPSNNNNNNNDNVPQNQIESQNNSNNNAPLTIHTFYSRTDDPGQDPEEIKNHQKVLQIWSETWKAMGYQTKILTLDDAKAHPQYEYFLEKLDHLPLNGYSGRTGHYNRLCYLRWLAMATDHVNGGFFSDFDVIPLKPPEPQDFEQGLQNFHVYEKGYVPALLSGSKQDWYRMIHSLIETGDGHLNEALHSDMFALQELGLNGKCECENYDQVMEGRYILTGRDLSLQDCEELKHYRAVHFSHNAIHNGVLKEGYGICNRSQIMLEWWKHYIETCGAML